MKRVSASRLELIQRRRKMPKLLIVPMLRGSPSGSSISILRVAGVPWPLLAPAGAPSPVQSIWLRQSAPSLQPHQLSLLAAIYIGSHLPFRPQARGSTLARPLLQLFSLHLSSLSPLYLKSPLLHAKVFLYAGIIDFSRSIE